MKHLMIGLLAVFGFPSLVAAQGLCDNPPTTLVMSPSPTFYVVIHNFDVMEPNGTPQVTDLQYALFAEGTLDPNTGKVLQGPTTIPRTALTVSTAKPCYSFTAPAAIPTTQRLVASVKPHRAASTGIVELSGPWALSNPFGAATQGALPALGRLVAR